MNESGSSGVLQSLAFTAALVVAACSGGGAPTDAGGDRGDDAVPSDAPATSTSGLDSRPANATCVAPAVGSVAQLLSQTGCVDPANPTRPAGGLVPYDINVPFWSDGMAKERFLSVPNGTTIDLDASGRLVFPNGAVLVKFFRQNGVLIETRLLMHHPDGSWAGYSYEWNATGTDATLVTASTERVINGQTWTFPSTADCARCHTNTTVFVLGTEVSQLNRAFTYASTGRTANQLSTYEAIGLLTATLPARPDTLPALPDPADTTRPLHDRVRAYLHSNCSGCHRPGGPTPAQIDLRYTTTDAMMNVCNVTPVIGNLGIANARLLSPGNPDLSLLYLRPTRRGLATGQMPPLATHVVDMAGTQLLRDWIQSLTACP